MALNNSPDSLAIKFSLSYSKIYLFLNSYPFHLIVIREVYHLPRSWVSKFLYTEESDSKYFGLCRPHMLCYNYSTLSW